MTPREFETLPLVVGAGGLWPQAIHADFFSAIGNGDLPREAFERWLVMRHSIDAGSLHAQESWQTKLHAANILELDRDATPIRDEIDVREQR